MVVLARTEASDAVLFTLAEHEVEVGTSGSLIHGNSA